MPHNPSHHRDITTAASATTVGAGILSTLGWYTYTGTPWLPIAILATVLTLAGAITYGVGKLLSSLPQVTSGDPEETPDPTLTINLDYPEKGYL